MILKKIVRLWRDGLRYLLIHLMPYEYFLSKTPKKHLSGLSVVVSLTTIPNRINKILPTLKSLTDQTVSPTVIYLAIPEHSKRENKPYIIPNFISECKNITIISSAMDYGPITKLLPALIKEKKSPNTIIIAVDDDNIYPKNFVETFCNEHLKNPKQALTLCGRNLTSDLKWPINQKSLKGTYIKTPTPIEIAMGCGGIMVKPEFFEDNFTLYSNVPEEAIYVDDIWINGHLAKNKVQRYVIPIDSAYSYLQSITTLGSLSIDKKENKDSYYNNTTIAYFRQYWR